MQAHARVCEENKRNYKNYKKKNERLWKQFYGDYGETYEFKGSYRKNGETYRDDNHKHDLP